MILTFLIAFLIVITTLNIGFMLLFNKEDKERKRRNNEVYNRFFQDIEEMNDLKKRIK